MYILSCFAALLDVKAAGTCLASPILAVWEASAYPLRHTALLEVFEGAVVAASEEKSQHEAQRDVEMPWRQVTDCAIHRK